MPGGTVFEAIASRITVRDIAEPIRLTIEDGTDPLEVAELLREEVPENPDPFALVLSAGLPLSVLSLDDLEAADPGESLSDLGGRLGPNDLVSANTRILDLIDLWAQSYHPLWVLDGNRVIGHVEVGSLYELPARLCLLALTLELEDEALQLLLIDPFRSQEALSPHRRALADEALRFRDEKRKLPFSSRELIRYTNYIDKGNVIKKLALVDGPALAKVNVTFDRAQTLRNVLAHTGSAWDLVAAFESPAALANALTEIRELTAVVRRNRLERAT